MRMPRGAPSFYTRTTRRVHGGYGEEVSHGGADKEGEGVREVDDDDVAAGPTRQRQRLGSGRVTYDAAEAGRWGHARAREERGTERVAARKQAESEMGWAAQDWAGRE